MCVVNSPRAKLLEHLPGLVQGELVRRHDSLPRSSKIDLRHGLLLSLSWAALSHIEKEAAFFVVDPAASTFTFSLWPER